MSFVLPREGPVSGQCDTCHQWGNLRVVHRAVWGQEAHQAPEVGQGCPGCGRQGAPDVVGRLVAQADPPAALAGVMPKLAAREVRWLVCPGCGHQGPEQQWVWLVCATPGCGRESRGTLHYEDDRQEEDSG